MSSEQSTEAAAGARRRIVALPTRFEPPVALIMREAEQRDSLTNQLGRRRAIAFPSLAHFLTEEQRKQPWAGIVVGYSCAWDAQLDRYVPHRSCIALYQVAEDEGYEWPEAVQRVQSVEQVETWLGDLLSPLPNWKKLLEEARRKPKPKRTRVSVAKAVQVKVEPRQLELGMSPPAADAAAASAQPAAAETRVRESVVPKSAPPKTLRPAAEAARPEKRGKAPAKIARVAPVPSQETLTHAIARAVLRDLRGQPESNPRLEGQLLAAAGELGVLRCREILERLRANAAAVRRGR
jgi:hypothetical protein